MQEKTAQTKLEDFQKIKYLGRGSFGEVHLVKNIQNEQLLAMKEIDKRQIVQLSNLSIMKKNSIKFCLKKKY